MRPFSKGHLSDALRSRLDETLFEIRALDTDYVLKVSPAELEQHYLEKAKVEPLTLHTDQQHIERREGIDVDVSHDFSRAIFPGEKAYVRGTRLDVAIPFEGDHELWQWSPSRYSMSGYPHIEIRQDRVTLSFSFPDDTANTQEIKGKINSDVKRLEETANTIHQDVVNFNSDLPGKIKAAIDARIARAREMTDVVVGLGIPIKRTTTPPTYAIPAKRRKSKRQLPNVPTQPYEPEPFLPEEEYEYILGVLQSMSLVIERNPTSFSSLSEEEIRNHFLLQLNGHYDGTATGETFNTQGKTDILIRERDRNVFIAECKFWRGPKSFDAAIDQLLGYLSWRDSKCALLVFNRTKDSSAVVKKMHEAFFNRSEFKKNLGTDPRGNNQYILVKPSDPGREIMLTTMLFDLPSS